MLGAKRGGRNRIVMSPSAPASELPEASRTVAFEE